MPNQQRAPRLLWLLCAYLATHTSNDCTAAANKHEGTEATEVAPMYELVGDLHRLRRIDSEVEAGNIALHARFYDEVDAMLRLLQHLHSLSLKNHAIKDLYPLKDLVQGIQHRTRYLTSQVRAYRQVPTCYRLINLFTRIHQWLHRFLHELEQQNKRTRVSYYVLRSCFYETHHRLGCMCAWECAWICQQIQYLASRFVRPIEDAAPILSAASFRQLDAKLQKLEAAFGTGAVKTDRMADLASTEVQKAMDVFTTLSKGVRPFDHALDACDTLVALRQVDLIDQTTLLASIQALRSHRNIMAQALYETAEKAPEALPRLLPLCYVVQLSSSGKLHAAAYQELLQEVMMHHEAALRSPVGQAWATLCLMAQKEEDAIAKKRTALHIAHLLQDFSSFLLEEGRKAQALAIALQAQSKAAVYGAILDAEKEEAGPLGTAYFIHQAIYETLQEAPEELSRSLELCHLFAVLETYKLSDTERQKAIVYHEEALQPYTAETCNSLRRRVAKHKERIDQAIRALQRQKWASIVSGLVIGLPATAGLYGLIKHSHPR